MADTICASQGLCPLRLKRGLPLLQSVTRAEPPATTTLLCFCAGHRAQDRAHLSPLRQQLTSVSDAVFVLRHADSVASVSLMIPARLLHLNGVERTPRHTRLSGPYRR